MLKSFYISLQNISGNLKQVYRNSGTYYKCYILRILQSTAVALSEDYQQKLRLF